MTDAFKLQIVTGLSGSGKSIALHTLEDMGYYCIDNLPVSLLNAVAEHLINVTEDIFNKTAVGIDARSQPDQISQLPEIVEKIRAQGLQCKIMFLEAQPDTLIKRYSETRRKHPLSSDDCPLGEAIELERRLLEPLVDVADLRIDTSHTNQHELRDLIRNRDVASREKKLSILFASFGFKHGIPQDADFIFDVRCLPNPHWEAELRPLTGRDQAVAEFLRANPETERMQNDLKDFLEYWIPRFEADSRSYLTIAIGCTGGQHRSVYLTEQLVRHFQQSGHQVLSRHRELS